MVDGFITEVQVMKTVQCKDAVQNRLRVGHVRNVLTEHTFNSCFDLVLMNV